MHRRITMAEAANDPDDPGFRGAWKGIWIGAVAGAVLVYVAAWILGVDIAAGGPGMWAMGGAAAGGLAGFFIGAIRRAGRDRNVYRGPERRMNRQPYPGVDRRHLAG
jgi:hypothetical protein